MLSITHQEFLDFGCPNCGCDFTLAGHVCAGGRTTGKCKNCDLNFEIRANNLGKDAESCTKYLNYRLDHSDLNPEYIMEYAIAIDHPRVGIPAWHWEPEDNPPKEGEYWSSRGPGYPDISGFVRTKQAGKRILTMVHKVLETENCKTFLDYRSREPLWVQFKFHMDEFDIYMLHTSARANDDIITEEIIQKCKLKRKIIKNVK